MNRKLNFVFAASLVGLAACGAPSPKGTSEAEPQVAAYIQVKAATCSSHLAAAGAVFTCPGNKFVTGIRDAMQPIGLFDSVTCCELRAGAYTVTPDYGSYQVTSTNFGQDRSCVGSRFIKGIGFDSGGGAGTMHCYRMRVGGYNVTKSAAYSNLPFYAGSSTSCPGNQAADGLGDALAPDGTIDSLHCRGGYRP